MHIDVTGPAARARDPRPTDEEVFATPFARTIFRDRYSKDRQESWADTAHRVTHAVCGDRLPPEVKNRIERLILERKFIPGGRYLYAAGREFHQVNNCFLFRAKDSREGWAEIQYSAAMSLMTGGGIGIDYSDVREEGALVRRTGGVATGPKALMQAVNEAGRQYVQGGNRRSAIWAGLRWSHPDVFGFLSMKDWSEDLRAMKEKDINFPLPMELTNISVIYDADFFAAFDNPAHALHDFARRVWMKNCAQAFRTAEPGFSINFKNARESLRNACTEVVSEDNDDKCNLGTVWMPRFKDVSEFRQAVADATAFLMCGGIYSDVPTDAIREVGDRNNRIGLGLGGMHEWLMHRRADYEVTPEMHVWLAAYRDESDESAAYWARALGVNLPKGKRAIAPTGTIGIIAETTTGIEPLFCAAYKRRFYTKEKVWKHQFVVDGAVKRLLAAGVPMELIDRNDAYGLTFEQRVRFQADVQDYVDMSISSTCNTAPWGHETNNEGTLEGYAKTLMTYARRLRGFTVYPDGARGAQPLTKVTVKDALAQEGMTFLETERECVNGVCGI